MKPEGLNLARVISPRNCSLCIGDTGPVTWELLVCNEYDEKCQALVRLQSVQGHILLPEGDGSVYCGCPRNTEHGYFLLRFYRHGKWTLQCMVTGHYLESDGEAVFCNSRVLSAYHMWTPRPAIHVHVVLYSPISCCYVRANPQQGCIWVDAPVPYLEECGFLLHFHEGLYHLESSSHHFLSQNDRLVSRPSLQTGFHLHFRPGGQIALGDGQGCLLYPQGSQSLLSLGSRPMGGEEWFVLQHCPTWITLKAKNRKFITIDSEMEACARSEEMVPLCFFQYESDPNSNAIQLRSVTGQYLAQRSHRAIIGDGKKLEAAAIFCVQWNCDRITLQAASGRYVGVTSNGCLIATSLQPGPCEEFRVRLVNRPFLALRGRYGYVGTSSNHDQMQCNMDQPDCIQLLPCRQSIYHFQEWHLLVPDSLWHLPSLGKVCSQLLSRTTRQQPACCVGPQWLLYKGGQQWCLIGGQQDYHQRVSLGVLGRQDATIKKTLKMRFVRLSTTQSLPLQVTTYPSTPQPNFTLRNNIPWPATNISMCCLCFFQREQKWEGAGWRAHGWEALGCFESDIQRSSKGMFCCGSRNTEEEEKKTTA
ncbi:fascin-3 isoform X2 [Monodelphis domestica]|uniref:fascin-3 isoform X2 n=1 Tax=Monodelphis domestica TaxID=13616 RepID=UPI0024E21DDE|nr:fascin-3 isoform X2 [Monodelphis domestica]